MSDISLFRRHRELFWAGIAAIILAVLPLLSFVDSLPIPVTILATVFLGILTVVGTLFILFQKYNNVINRAKDKDKLGLIKAVFMYPAVAAAAGLLYLLALSFVEISFTRLLPNELSKIPALLQDFILLFLAFYSILSLVEALSFLRRIMIGES